MADEIFIFCDDPSHAPKREPVDVFVLAPDGTWSERPIKKRKGRAGHVGTGMHLLGDVPAKTGWALDPDAGAPDLRTKFQIVCERTRYCSSREMRGREENLFAVLTRWHDLGLSEMPLPRLAAMMQERVERYLDPSRGSG